jgi:hypothetical protein
MRQADIGIVASLVLDGPERGPAGRRGQVLNWIGAKRYEALRSNGRNENRAKQ